MNLFADNLSMLLKENNISFRKGAQDIGIDRTALKRYSEGERLPKNAEIVERIAKGLNLDEETSQRLIYNYEIEKKGIKNYMIGKLLEQLDSMYTDEKAEECKQYVSMMPEAQIKSWDNLYNSINYIMNDVDNIKMIVDAGNGELVNRIYSNVDRTKECTVEHIIELDRDCSKDNKTDFDVFENMIKSMIKISDYCSNTTYYRVRNVASPIRNQIVISGKGMLMFRLFEDKEPLGLLENRQHVISYYMNIYNNIKEECSLYSCDYCKGNNEDMDILYRGREFLVGEVLDGIAIMHKECTKGTVFCENDLVKNIRNYYRLPESRID